MRSPFAIEEQIFALNFNFDIVTASPAGKLEFYPGGQSSLTVQKSSGDARSAPPELFYLFAF
ncbi:hypothetical protein MTY_1690 [Moorella thermoacetica Y72]|uniref:Uncharacterized protein n=1 Tax=Moorella thermoacetica Y72 TaxID=1325331 RepID=A0A0S6UD39_NEOTH|nr:hypothetical protein MTY_1690 [Moorella thermoacetica Y72]